METEDIDKILSKSYSELNTAERETIQEICSSEEEFLQLQQFFASVENYAKETQEDHFPAPEIKDRLDELFHQTYQNKGILWYNSAWTALYPADKRFDQRPLVRIAAILVVLISIVPFLNGPKSEAKTSLAKIESVQKEKDNETAIRQEDKKEEIGKVQFNAAAKANKTVSVNRDQMAEDIQLAPVSQGTFEKGIVFQNNYAPSTASAFTTLSANGAATTFTWTHSDGIYMDTFSYESDAYTVKGNMAVLDLLTPTF